MTTGCNHHNGYNIDYNGAVLKILEGFKPGSRIQTLDGLATVISAKLIDQTPTEYNIRVEYLGDDNITYSRTALSCFYPKIYSIDSNGKMI